MPPDPLGAALPGRLCGPTTLSQAGYTPVSIVKQYYLRQGATHWGWNIEIAAIGSKSTIVAGEIWTEK